MSANNPNREERERIVNDVVNNKLRKDFIQNAPTELDTLIHRIQEADSTVRLLITPIATTEIENGNAHTVKGRAALLNTTLKFYLDYLKDNNREELLFLLALTRAEIMMGQFV